MKICCFSVDAGVAAFVQYCLFVMVSAANPRASGRAISADSAGVPCVVWRENVSVLLIGSSCAGTQDFVALNASGVRDGVLGAEVGSVPHVGEEFL